MRIQKREQNSKIFRIVALSHKIILPKISILLKKVLKAFSKKLKKGQKTSMIDLMKEAIESDSLALELKVNDLP